MRKWVSIVLSSMLVFNLAGTTIAKADETVPDFLADANFDFDSLDDPAFLQYLEDSVYASLEAEVVENEDIYVIDDVSVTFVSREYLEETAYNSKENIFFGYSLAQIDEVFQGGKYVFTLSDEGDTIVQKYMAIPSDTYDRIIKNVLIGTGVILICVTVTVLTAGTATPAALAAGATTGLKVHMFFAASANTAAAFATKGALFAGATTLVTRGFETGWDMDAMVESALVNSSEAFKWGAISGAVVGGGREALHIHKVSRGPITPREAEKVALEYFPGGREQVTYLEGEEVPWGTPGGVRPDIVVGNEAIEVKCYDLKNPSSLNGLKRTLTTEISQRITHLPEGMTQRIVINVEGRGYTAEFVEKIITWIGEFMEPIYPNIPIDVMGETL